MTTTENAIAAMPDAQRAPHAAVPYRVVGAWPITVFSGLVAAMLLSFSLAVSNKTWLRS